MKYRTHPHKKQQTTSFFIYRRILILSSTQNYTTHDDNQKYVRKHLGRKYGTIPLPSRSRQEKITMKLEKIKLKMINKQCSIVFDKTCLNNLLPKYTLPYIHNKYVYYFYYNFYTYGGVKKTTIKRNL